MQKKYVFKFLLIVTLLFLASCSYAQKDENVKRSLETTISEKEASANIENLLKKQVLLTNRAQFTGNRNLEGASGFLIKYNGATFAVTARHLLGEAGGIEPKVNINELGGNLLKWEMSPRVISNAGKETVKLNAKGLDFSNSSNDIVLLNAASNTFDLGILTPDFDLPAAGKNLFLIGCPYSERQCRQNYYKAKFAEFDETEGFLVVEIFSNVELSGFSGAPLVNGKGNVVGILVGSFESNGKFYITATPITEIQKIKF